MNAHQLKIYVRQLRPQFNVVGIMEGHRGTAGNVFDNDLHIVCILRGAPSSVASQMLERTRCRLHRSDGWS